MRRILVLVAAMPWLVPGANADNGVLEINQACVSVGCFSGDTEGYPVQITAPGSYRLTSNLIVPNVATTGIEVDSNDVGIDLNNFAIIRSGCESSCAVVSGEGTGIKQIRQEPTNSHGLSVKNGSIVGMGDNGVVVGQEGEVRNVRARWNGGLGIGSGNGSAVKDSLAQGNGGYGIWGSAGCTVTGNTTYENGDVGTYSWTGSTITGNTSYENVGNGIGTGTYSNVSGNTSSDNTGCGLSFEGSAGYRDNVINGNSGGTVCGAGVDAGGNVCNNSTTCP